MTARKKHFIETAFFIAGLFVLFQTSALLGGAGEPPEKEIKLDVRYGPTPPEVVSKMIEVAQVTQNDIVYDLGCGDGRIVIMAAKISGARGVGVDLDPQRIKQSKENAQREGVAGRVKFLQQDLFQSLIKDATVVMLYLSPEVNVRLRQKLFADLKPGTRVLSHNHDMGGWEPDRYVEMGRHRIYLWIMPADVAGVWKWPLKIGNRVTVAALHLEQEFQKVRGTLAIGDTMTPLASAELKGRSLEISAEPRIDGRTVPIKFSAELKDGRLHGRMEMPGGTGGSPEIWTSLRGKPLPF